jgi:SsrA-binding protein
MAEGEKLISANKKARFDYQILKVFEAGMVLRGSEVKSCRDSKVQLLDSYAGFERGELWLYKVNIGEYKQSGPFFNHETTRKRKLLMHRKELANIKAEMEQSGATLVPLRMYFKAGKAKVELGLAKGKTKGDKRQTIKTKDAERSMRQAIKRG